MKQILLLCLALATPCPFYGQTTAHRLGQVLQRSNGTTTAQLVPFAKILICASGPGCTAVPVYQDPGLTVPFPQPLTADNQGNYSYYAIPACYKEQIMAPGQPMVTVSGVCLAAPNGSGSGGVSSVSVSTANGFSGTVANPTTVPNISINVDGTHYLPTLTDEASWNAKADKTSTSQQTFNGAIKTPALLLGSNIGTTFSGDGQSIIVQADNGQIPIPPGHLLSWITDTAGGGHGAGDSGLATANVCTTSGNCPQFISSITTTGSSGPATVVSGVLNIPQYAGGGSMTWPAGGAGIPNYNGSSAWGTSYSASNTIPANFISTLAYLPSSTQLPVTKAAVTSNFLTSYTSSTGVFTSAQPAFSDISGTASAAQLPVATTGAFGAVKPDGTSITISGGIISAPSGGSGTVTHTGALTSGFVMLGNGTADSKVSTHIDDSITTAGTITSTEPIAAPSFRGMGTTPTALSLPAGTGSIPALAANSAGFAAPVTGGTSYLYKLPATATAGILHAATPGTVDGVLESALTSSAVSLTADVTGILPVANGGTGTTSPALVAGTNVTITGTWPNQTISSSGSGGVANISVVVASGTMAANTCSASPVTATMTGATTTMKAIAGYSGNPAALTGWGSTGGMVFDPWISATNTLSYVLCNSTASSIPYSAITFIAGAN